MSEQDYNPHSINAVLSRIETKLNTALDVQEQQNNSIRRLWTHLGRLDVRVAVIACGVSGLVMILKLLFAK